MNKQQTKTSPSTLDTKLDEQTIQDVKYQHITYYKSDGIEDIHNQPIDFIKAMHEMENLPICNGYNHFIGFTNHHTIETLQFLRYDNDKWYADTIINGGRGWDGYSWGAEIDNNKMAATLRLFFEEVPWFGMISWTLRRYKPCWKND